MVSNGSELKKYIIKDIALNLLKNSPPLKVFSPYVKMPPLEPIEINK